MTVWVLAGAAALLAVGWTALRQQHPVLAVLGSVFCGLAALGLVMVTAPVTGVSLPLNGATAFVSAVLGAPGVTALLLLMLLMY